MYDFMIFADLSSLRDGTVIEEEEKPDSSSGSSACMVGTTTQGLESTPPPKGKKSNLKVAGRQIMCPQSDRTNTKSTTFIFMTCLTSQHLGPGKS